jgi:hypothetical protein
MPQGDVTFVGGNAPVQVAATASPGTTIFTAVSGTAQVDAVRIVASNIDPTTTIDLTIEWCGTAGLNQLVFSLGPKSMTELPVMRANNGAVVKAFASVASKINCYVDANRYTL